MPGTDDPSSYLAVPAAIDFQREHDWPTVRANCRLLVQDARDRIAALTGLPPIAPDSDDWWRQLAVIPLPAIDAGELKSRLYDDYGIEIPCVVFGGKNYVRISIQAYNTQDDVDRLVNAVREIFNL